tara:strand:+ start:2352 stop:2765 length:414 start_codon:yes stop_codon:yes gene_type:complete
MLDIIKSTLSMIGDLLGLLASLVVTISVWLGQVAYYLHTEMPRLEGLLVGVALAWLLLRREKHPLLRVLSAPLKLVLDILDLAWDQAVEVVKDLWASVASLSRSMAKKVQGGLSSAYSYTMKKLRSVKDKLSKTSGG